MLTRAVCLIFLPVACLCGCASSVDSFTLDERDNGTQLGVRVGDEIVVVLSSALPGPQEPPDSWPPASLSSDALGLVSAGPTIDGESSMPIAIAYLFEARHTGAATITIPVESEPFTVNVVVLFGD